VDGAARDPLGWNRDLPVAGALTCACLTLYLATLTPELGFPFTDSHELTLNAIRLGVPHPSGYPLYTWLGFLFVHLLPIGEAAHRLNLMSATFGAGSVGVLFLVARKLGLGALAAGYAALSFGVATTFWSQAVITEVYAPDIFLLALTLDRLLAWAAQVRAGADGTRPLLGFALLWGLSLGTHLSNLSFGIAFAVFGLATDPSILRRPRHIGLAFLAFAVGAMQYVWLPLRGALYDQYPNPDPTTLEGMHAYTLGAFQAMRFAFPIELLPVRIAMVAEYLAQNFGWTGIALGTAGMWACLWWYPARFWLLFIMYATNVILFSQFAAPDLEVFFLAGYVAWAMFVGFGVQSVVAMITRGLGAKGRQAARASGGLLTAALATILVSTAVANYRDNDRSRDTLVPDFARNVYDLLPKNSAVAAPRGVFAADLLYWQVALGMRPDVTILGQRVTTPAPKGAPLFTSVRLANGRPIAPGIGGPAPGDLPPGAWYVPVLFGNTRALALARVQPTPPIIFVEDDMPVSRVRIRLGSLTLVGVEAKLQPAAPRPRLHVRTWWILPSPRRFVVGTSVDEHTLEMHSLGLGNLERYAAEVIAEPTGLLHEEYDVVVPSRLAPGEHAIRIGMTEFDERHIRTHWSEVARVVIE
jgi:Protein of unknown function (DUF2723)